jgi:hypothetical protein
MDPERELRALAVEIAWPETPPLRPALPERGRDLRRVLVAAGAAALAALAVAFAVPQSRAAILRFLHLGAASVQFVERLPVAQERPLAADLGPTLTAAAAKDVLHGAVLLPPLGSAPPLHGSSGVVSMVFRYRGSPVLLSEVYDRDGVFLKKLAASATRVRSVRVGGEPGLWLSGALHVFLFPGAPPRLAGNVLLWQHGSLTVRLEGRALSETDALTLARRLR